MKNIRQMSIGVLILSQHWIRIIKFLIRTTNLRKIKKEEEELDMFLKLKILFSSRQVFRILLMAFIKVKNAMIKNFRIAVILMSIVMIFSNSTIPKIRMSSSFRKYLILTLALMKWIRLLIKVMCMSKLQMKRSNLKKWSLM